MDNKEPENYCRLVGTIKKEPMCWDWGGVSFRLIIPKGYDRKGNMLETTMPVMCVDDAARVAKGCGEGELVRVEGMLNHYQNKRTQEWQTQVKADRCERLAFKEPPLGNPHRIDDEEDLPF